MVALGMRVGPIILSGRCPGVRQAERRLGTVRRPSRELERRVWRAGKQGISHFPRFMAEREPVGPDFAWGGTA
jgi:hypothetical protein